MNLKILFVVLCLSAYAILLPLVIVKINLVGTPPSTVTTISTLETVALSSSKMCVSKDHDLQEIINASSTVFFLMPAKSAGQATGAFAYQCSKEKGRKRLDLTKLDPTLEVKAGTISSKHLNKKIANDYVNWFKHASRQTLFIWSHRDETDRLISAIRHVVLQICSGYRIHKTFQPLEQTNDRCIVNDNDIIEKLIKEKHVEIGLSNDVFLTCEMYQALRENFPTMLISDFRNTDDLQVFLARKHCPTLLPKLPIRANVAEVNHNKSSQKIMVQLSRQDDQKNQMVGLNDWLKEKGPHLEMMLQMKNNTSCLSTTRHMEDALNSCDDHILRINNAWLH